MMIRIFSRMQRGAGAAAFVLLLICLSVSNAEAHTGQTRQNGEPEKDTERFVSRYNLLVSRLGYDGVGIETLLNAWEAVDSTDIRIPEARFNYYFTRSRRDSVVTSTERKHLGMTPVLSLKDSTGTDIHYYQEYFYDDSLFSIAMKHLDKAIREHPERLDMRFLKADALCAYEKGSPDMAKASLESLIGQYCAGGTEWTYPGETVDDAFFKDMIQQYCALFFNTGTAGCYEAFRSLSGTMLSHYKDDTTFMDNMGSYLLVAKDDCKGALKWYNKVLKIKPDDYTAIRNGLVTARKMRNVKLQKKFLNLLVEYGNETDRRSAEAQLKALESK